MAEIAVLKTHILNYSKTRDVYVAYRKAGYSRAFFEAHREEITLHKAAKQAFSDLGVDKIPTIKQLNEEYGELLAQKKEAYKHYREAKQEMTDFATAKYDIERFLNLSQEESQHQEQVKKINRYERNPRKFFQIVRDYILGEEESLERTKKLTALDEYFRFNRYNNTSCIYRSGANEEDYDFGDINQDKPSKSHDVLHIESEFINTIANKNNHRIDNNSLFSEEEKHLNIRLLWSIVRSF